MGSVKEEITRLETAKKDIETAIETCGVNVPDTELIDTYASYIRQIPSAVFSGLNVDPVGGSDQFIQSIKQTNGLIEATVGGLVSTSNSGLVPKADGSAGTINNQSDDYVLTYKGGTIDWYKLPANAFKNDDNNTTYTLSGALNGNAYDVTLTPSSGSATGAKVPAMGAASSSAAGTAGLVPAPAKNQHNSFLRGDGTWVVPDNTTYSVMTGATASAAGKSGLVPQPAKGDQGKFLSGAGTWTALPSLSITDSESGNAVTDVEVSGHGITLKRGTTFSVNGHKHSSDDITALTSYIKATTVAAIASTDSLNSALGKLELKADTAYNLVKGAYDGDGTIENLAEILKVLEGISDTDTIKAIIGKYLPLAGGMMTGNITFDADRMIRWHQSDSYSISCPTGGDGAYLLLKAHNGTTVSKRLSIYKTATSLPNTVYNLYTDGSLYAASATFGGTTTITGGSDLNLQAGSTDTSDAGDIVFKNYSGTELGRIWLDSTASQALSLRYGANDATKRILHSGNSSVSKSGQTLTVKINGVEQSITNSTYSTLPNPYNISFKDTSNNTVTYNGSSALDLTGGIYYAVTANTASLLAKQGGTSTAASVWNPKTSWTKVWGQNFVDSSINSDTGDIIYYLRNGEYGSGSSELCVVIDGDYYAGVGQYKVWHAGNLTKVSQLSNDAGYLTSLPSHVHTYIESKPNYSFTSSTLPNSFDWGISAGFVADNAGYGSYGSVLTVRTYTGGGGTLQLYAPYSKTYGGTRLKARFGDYDKSNGNSWTDLKEIAWTSDIPTVTDYYWANVKVSSTSSTTTSPTFASATAGQFIANNASGPHFTGTSTAGNWAYLRLNNSSVVWDIATRTTSGSGGLWLSRYGGGDNGIFVSAASTPKVGINTSSPSYPLHVAGDTYTSGWSRSANGFYVHDTGVHFTHQGTLGEIDMTSNNEFLWGSSSADLYFNYRAVSRGTTVTTYRWHAGSSSSYASHILGKITAQSTASSWLDGQRYARGGFNLMDATDTGSYWPWMRQTNTGSSKWFSMGVLGDSLYFIGSSTSKTDNGYDYGFRMDFSNGYLYGNFSGYLSGTAYSAEAIKDSSNGTRITACYSTGGFSSNPSWLAAWNGYHLTYVSPSVLSVNYASSAGSASYVAYTSRQGKGSGVAQFAQYSGATDNPTNDWYSHIIMNHANNAGYYTEIATCFHEDAVYFRRQASGTTSAWKQFAWTTHNHDNRYAWGNYASQSELSDCNSVSSTGFWTHSGFANRPDDVANWGSLMNIRLYDSNNNYHRQLFFDCYGTDKIWTRSDNGGTWTSWKRLALASEIPSVGNGTVTINQAGASKGSFTLNQSTAATINLTDTNYYPTAFSWTGGTTAGPTGSLTGVGMTAVSFGAIPAASGSASGIVTTASQTFAGEKTFHTIRLRQPSTSGNTNFGGYLYFGDGSYAYIAELSDDELYYHASGGHYFEGLNHNFAPVLVGTIYRKPAATSGSVTSNSIGIDSSSGATKNIGISVSKSRAGKYAVTLTNNTSTTVRIHAPVITSSHGDWGGGSCYESPFAYLDHNSTCVFPKTLSAGSTLSFNIICGKIHTQGNWSTGDFTKSNDDSGFVCSIYASYSGNIASG